MNLKNNKGYTGVDVSVAIILIMLFIPTIFGMTYNIRKARADIAKKSYATKIATEIIGYAKLAGYEKIASNQFWNDNFWTSKYSETSNSVNFVEDTNYYDYKYYYLVNNSETNNGNYVIQVGLGNYFAPGSATAYIIKKVKVVVAYDLVGTELKKVEIVFPIVNEMYARKVVL